MLIPKFDMSRKTKLFIITVIAANKYRYNHGRQANITLPDIELKLPVSRNHPDWEYMDNFVDELPYGEKL